ncbi:hypothetical protein KUTeg_018920 [Tegillarca granosa]|uniref:Uncharacterized protein n=1 Tax=Tegillarca granosa TaxID=220873 RepID=A0ABQ9EB07_TEGGR|nr:hypothetical protein KUTeg_018920 [Tegillarca granosa]
MQQSYIYQQITSFPEGNKNVFQQTILDNPTPEPQKKIHFICHYKKVKTTKDMLYHAIYMLYLSFEKCNNNQIRFAVILSIENLKFLKIKFKKKKS